MDRTVDYGDLSKHSATCRRRIEQNMRARGRWQLQYPHACFYCYARTDSENPCVWCLAGGICPRCGGEGTVDAEDASIPCSACGWVEDAGMGCPDVYVCTCRVAQGQTIRAEISTLEKTIKDSLEKIHRLNIKLARIKRGGKG